MADSTAATTRHPGTTQGGLTRGQAGAVSDDSSITLDGSSGYVASDSTIDAPVAFSESVWFKTTTRRGGVLVAQTSVPTGSGGTPDRALVMDNNGNVVFGLGRTGIRNQGPIWNDGKWHQAVGTYDGNGTANLYVDGWLQSCTTPTAASPQCATLTRLPVAPAPGYLRAGYADMTNMQLVFSRNFYARKWPLSDYFNGSLDEVTAFDRALTASEVSTMRPPGWPTSAS